LLAEAPAGGYIRGEFTLADIPMMVLAMVLEVDQPDLGAWPKTRRYLDFVRERESYRAISPQTKVADATGLPRSN
jgi:glutathione S-transferase